MWAEEIEEIEVIEEIEEIALRPSPFALCSLPFVLRPSSFDLRLKLKIIYGKRMEEY